jgi:hypothetical protein
MMVRHVVCKRKSLCWFVQTIGFSTAGVGALQFRLAGKIIGQFAQRPAKNLRSFFYETKNQQPTDKRYTHNRNKQQFIIPDTADDGIEVLKTNKQTT